MLALEASTLNKESDRGAFRRLMNDAGVPPHCDQRVLHRPEDCAYCAKALVYQAEREMLGVRNTGVEGDQPGRLYACPAELARSKESLGSWGGNRAVTEVDYVAQALRSPTTDLGYPGEPPPGCLLCEHSPCICPA